MTLPMLMLVAVLVLFSSEAMVMVQMARRRQWPDHRRLPEMCRHHLGIHHGPGPNSAAAMARGWYSTIFTYYVTLVGSPNRLVVFAPARCWFHPQGLDAKKLRWWNTQALSHMCCELRISWYLKWFSWIRCEIVNFQFCWLKFTIIDCVYPYICWLKVTSSCFAFCTCAIQQIFNELQDRLRLGSRKQLANWYHQHLANTKLLV